MPSKRKQQNSRQVRGRGRKRRQKGMCLEDRPVLEPNAAGIDIGAREIFIAVPPGRDEQPVRACATFTEDIEQLADWLVACRVTTVAMESTGVYWIPLYDILESRGLQVCLVNARHMKNVPGRRTDWHECQWLQYLHSVGLLRGAFRPEVEVTAVRTVMRHRHELVQMSSQHVLHMHKALTQMNLQIHHVIDDITGLTGLAIVDAILAGQYDPAELAKLRNWRIQADEETIRKSLVGKWAGICRSGRPPTTLPPGRGCARTTTSAEAGCCGRVHGNSTTGLGKCSGKPLSLCITVSPRWEPPPAGGSPDSGPPQRPPPPPTRSQ